MARLASWILTVSPVFWGSVFWGSVAWGSEAWQGLTADGREVALVARPVPVDPTAQADGVTPAGAWHLTSDEPAFGGLSGLLVRGDRLLAVTDRGTWLTARLAVEGAALALTEVRMAPLRNSDGGALAAPGSDFADAEALAADPAGGVVVAFERVHRAIAYRPDGAPERVIRGHRFQFFAGNGGLEALATLPDGAVLALVEEAEADGYPQLVLREGAPPLEGRLAQSSRHSVTGADMGPDGRLYVVFRHWSRSTGTSIRLRRYRLGSDGLALSETEEELAAWERESGVDNMEAVAVVPSPDGLTLWLLADDNFNAPAQRTLLLRLRVAG